MTWPARTWVTAELVTASLMNGYLRDPISDLGRRAIVVTIGDPVGPVLATGVKHRMPVPFDCTVTGWQILADAVGDIVIDVWKDTYANFPPTDADSIAGTELPTLSSAQKNEDTALTTWDVQIDAGEILAYNIDSCSGIRQVTLTLYVEHA